MNIVIAILIFSLIVLFHELGHFALAKKNGIRVNEFCLGLGPTLIGFTKGETKYSIKLLPFGGACMMEGEDGDGETSEPNSFQSKSVWARISVVAAGPIFNFILAFVLALIFVSIIGYDKPVVGQVKEGFPAQEAGIQAGDTILSMNGHKMRFFRDVSLFPLYYPGEEIHIVFERNGEKMNARIMPRYDEESGRSLMGLIGGGEQVKASNPLILAKYSAYEVGYWIHMAMQSLRMLVTGHAGVQDLAGPVGLVKVIGDTYNESKSNGLLMVFVSMLNISILLSANLGVMNLLPIPALDGGRLVFLVLEAIRGKRIDPDKEGRVHFAGFMLLMGLMVFVMFHDIQRLF
ncbi:putative zinc metalloprotease [Clostridia bacterium]|nr:putative zinc metalloprotease [Clostridia bacterium]